MNTETHSKRTYPVVAICEPTNGGYTEAIICEDEEELELYYENSDWIVRKVMSVDAYYE